jgi:hypothetical protein
VEGTVGIEERKRLGTLTASGAVELNNAAVFGGGRLTATATCRGNGATVDQLELERGDERLIAARGEIEFGDLRRFHALFFPTQPIADVTRLPSGSCVNGFSFDPHDGAPPNANVSEIEVRGGLFVSDWALPLIDAHSDAPGERVTRTFKLCGSREPAGEVRLSSAPSRR